MNKLNGNEEDSFVIEAASTCFIIQQFLVDENLVFVTTVREQEIHFRADQESGDLKPNFYPINVERDIIDEIGLAIEKHFL
jgi:hypothetical protein